MVRKSQTAATHLCKPEKQGDGSGKNNEDGKPKEMVDLRAASINDA